MLRAIAVMAACLVVAVGAAGLTAEHDVGAAPAPIHTHAGVMQGGRVGETTYYLGVPFAEKPMGNLRFRSPLPKAPWEGILEALKFGPDCATYVRHCCVSRQWDTLACVIVLRPWSHLYCGCLLSAMVARWLLWLLVGCCGCLLAAVVAC